MYYRISPTGEVIVIRRKAGNYNEQFHFFNGSMVISSIRAVDGIFDKASGGQNAEKKTTTFNYFINLLSAL